MDPAQLPNETVLRRVTEEFRKFDLNGNGQIEHEELARVLSQLDPEAWTESNIQKLMFFLDRNRSGTVDFKEFLSWALMPNPSEGAGLLQQRLDAAAEIQEFVETRRSRDGGGDGNRQGTDPAGQFSFHAGQPAAAPPVDPVSPSMRALGSARQRVSDFYELLEEIGTGHFGTVVKARHIASGSTCAAKIIVKDAVSKLKRRPPDARLELRDRDVGTAVGRSQTIGVLACPEHKMTLLKVSADLWVRTKHPTTGSIAKAVVEVELRRGDTVISRDEAFALRTTLEQPRHSGSRCFSSHDAIIWRARPGDDYLLKFKFREGRSYMTSAVLQTFVASAYSGKLAREIALMKEIDHPSVVRLFDAFEDDRCVYLCMEACNGKELFQAIIDDESFSEGQAAVLMRQAFSAIHYMHGLLIMHRDLKLENMMLLRGEGVPIEDNVLKIIDLGSACNFPCEGLACTTKVGAPYYMAPEVIQESYDHPCDVWSLGVVCYILLCGRPPFDHEDDEGVLMQVLRGKYSFEGPEWQHITDDAKEAIRGCLTFAPADRMTAEDATKHTWLSAAAPDRRLSPGVYQNFKSFWAGSLIRRLSCVLISRHVDAETLARLNDEWATLDQDRSGALTPDELRDGLMRAGLGLGTGKHGWQTWLHQTFPDVSITGTKINYTTFLAAAMDRHFLNQEEACYTAFRSCDVDGNGEVSRRELASMLRSSGMADAVGLDSLEAALRSMDMDADGTIDFWEFLSALRGADSLGAR